MINLTNHHTSCNSSTYAPSVAISVPYRISKSKQTVQNKVKHFDQPSCQNGRNIFKSKGLLCWRSDVWYLSLRCGFLNLISACHIIWTVVKNNGKIAFVNHGGPQDEKAHLSLTDLLVQTQIKPKATPRLNFSASTAHAKSSKICSKSFNSKSSGLLNQSTVSSGTTKYKQQKGYSKPKPLLELCSLLQALEFTPNVSKKGFRKPNTWNNSKAKANNQTLVNTKLESTLCQSKINGLKCRLNLITYGNETAPAKGYFSNSNATFKSQLGDLLPRGDRKSKCLNIMSEVFKNCKRRQRTQIDLSKSSLSLSNAIEADELTFKYERTYVEADDSPNYVEAELYSKNKTQALALKGQTKNGQKFNNRLTMRQPSYSQRYYGKINQPSAQSLNRAAKFMAQINRKKLLQTKGSKPEMIKRRKSRLLALNNVKPFHDIGSHLLKQTVKPYLRSFWAKLNRSMPYCQPYWIGTNVYKQMGFTNNVNSTKNFAINPFISQANLVIFSHPEKVLGLVNQVRNLRIPTIGFVSGSNKLDHQTPNIVDFHILGNAENLLFVTCALQNFIRLLNHANPSCFTAKAKKFHTEEIELFVTCVLNIIRLFNPFFFEGKGPANPGSRSKSRSSGGGKGQKISVSQHK